MSEYWKRKLRTYFARLDFDNDGVISKEDWVGMGIRFGSFKNSDKQKAEHLKNEFEKLWEQFMSKALTDGKKGMTVDVFIDSIGKQRYDPALIQSFSGVIYGLFDLMDVDSDGFMQDVEYEQMLSKIGMPDPFFTKEAFKAIDVNGDGKLSYEEFIHAFSEFMFSEDDKSPYGNFFGPLID